MKKKYIIGIIILAVILIGAGVFTQVFNTKNKKDNKTSNLDNRDFYTEIAGRHCVGSLCIDTISVEYLNDNTGNLGFVLINTDEANVQIGGHFTLTPDSSSPLLVYFNDLQPGDMRYVKVDFSDKKVTEMKDYVLSDLVADGNEEA